MLLNLIGGFSEQQSVLSIFTLYFYLQIVISTLYILRIFELIHCNKITYKMNPDLQLPPFYLRGVPQIGIPIQTLQCRTVYTQPSVR